MVGTDGDGTEYGYRMATPSRPGARWEASAGTRALGLYPTREEARAAAVGACETLALRVALGYKGTSR